MEDVFKRFLILFCIAWLSACQTSKFLNQSADDHDTYACVIEDEACGLKFKDGDGIVYVVESLGDGRYSVTGNVDIHWLSTGTFQYVTFYILFMNDERVVYEKKLKTRRKASFDFEFETDISVRASTIEDLLLWNRS